MELQRELSYGQPDGSPRRAILALFFFLSVGDEEITDTRNNTVKRQPD